MRKDRKSVWITSEHHEALRRAKEGRGPDRFRGVSMRDLVDRAMALGLQRMRIIERES